MEKSQCGAKTRSGEPCKRKALANGRCRLHGGKSTGPKTLLSSRVTKMP
ncbi:HGGxSTG domain-containing protein [Bacillales bacterium AN1005]